MEQMLLDPQIWIAFLALVTMEIVLGIDNLVFISIVAGKVEEARRDTVRRLGLGIALALRIALLFAIAHVVALTRPVIDLGITGPQDSHGVPMFETSFSWRDLIMIGGGLFLVWKAVKEISFKLDPEEKAYGVAREGATTFAGAIFQIVMLDAVFSIDSILTAVGMTSHVPVMVAAVIVAVGVMFWASGPVMRFVNANPTVVMLALAFLLMIGMVLIADGFGHHVPKGYIYAAMGFAAFVETLNLIARNRRRRLAAARAPQPPR